MAQSNTAGMRIELQERIKGKNAIRKLADELSPEAGKSRLTDARDTGENTNNFTARARRRYIFNTAVARVDRAH